MPHDTAPHWLHPAIWLAVLLAVADLAWPGNRALFLLLNANLGPAQPVLWSLLTASGDTLVALVLWLPLLLWRPRFLAVVLVALLPVGGAVHLLKALVALPRPATVLEPQALTVLGPVLHYSAFPSGHAATAFALAGMLAAARQRALFWLALAWAAGVGLSRIAVGAHWPQDVTAGAALGFVGGALVQRLLAARCWPESAAFAHVTRGLAALLAAALLLHSVRDPVADAWLPVLAGWGGGALLARLHARCFAPVTVLAGGVGGALLLFVLTRMPWHEALQQLHHTPPSYLAVPLLALLLSYGLRAWRLALQLPALRAQPWLALRLTLLHNAFNNLLPFRSGEASLPWLLHRHGVAPPALGVGLLGFMRLQDAAAIGLCVLWWLLPWPPALRLVLSGAVVAGLWGLPAWLQRLPPRLPRRWRQLAWQVAAGAPRGLCFWQTAALSLVNWACKLAGFAWLVAALLHVPERLALSGVIGAEATGILPLHAPAGLGTWEAGLVAGLGLHGLPLAAALPAAFMLHALVLSLSLLSLVLLLPPRLRGTALGR